MQPPQFDESKYLRLLIKPSHRQQMQRWISAFLYHAKVILSLQTFQEAAQNSLFNFTE
jgi:hypothetical protein